ncbi:hypothetical protein QYM36_006062, partial [Artemia franciscana]
VRKVSNTLERLELTELPDIQRMHQELQRTLVLPTTDYNGRISEVQQSIAEITARVSKFYSVNELTEIKKAKAEDCQMVDSYLQLAVPDPHEADQGTDKTQESSVVFSVTPKQLRSVPHLPPTATEGRGVKQRRKTRIPTGTSEMSELEQMVENGIRSQNKVVVTLPKKARNPRVADWVRIVLMNLCLGEKEPDNLFNVNILAADEFVLVVFVINKRNIFYVGHVAETGDDYLEQKVIIVTPLMQGFFIYAIEKSKLASSSPMPICHLTGNPSKRTSIAPFRHQVNSLSVRILQIEQTLQTNDCSSNPCRNGGTCIDNYGRYQCLCPMAWEGENCETDVNECSIFAGTDLGCQNGATCINLPGTYRCECANGWYGAHCISKSNACSDSNRGELCGNGICISQSGTANGYSCICNQGWKSSTNAPACIVDVDECQSPKPPCSVAPVVQCLNTPGSYMCGPCPQGYSGNGHYCVDVDECQFNNGGCSQMPLVQCINTVGSRQCGPCPVGYEGDGVSCRYVGACSANNGGCHPLATCIDNPAISTSYVFCQCRPGYTGSGMGPLGCMPMQGQSTNDIIPSDGAIIHADPCSSNPCAATGTCLARATTFVCLCAPGYTGQRCEAQLDLCESQPCLNGGTCSSNGAVYSCICPTGFTGYNCETQLQTCGGFFPAVEGTISFPSSESDLYPHLVSCAWVITTRPGKVLNVTFTRFNIEGSTVNQCLFDWLQIHEGEDVQGKLLGKFCGTALPLGGNFNTTHDSLYLWFRSDHSTAGNGFQLSWNTIDPVCGGVLPEANHGVINSPSYPGKYPPNRDCYWTVQVPPGKRIQFTFATLQMEHHDNCTFDFLEVRDGSHDYSPLLGKFCSTG